MEKTVPSGEFLGWLHCAAGQCEGSLGIFLGQNLGGKTLGAAPPWFCSLGFALGKSLGSPHTAPQHSVGTRGILLRGQFFNTAPRIFNSCSDYQNHEVYLPANTFTGLVHTVVGSANRNVAQKFGIGPQKFVLHSVRQQVNLMILIV